MKLYFFPGACCMSCHIALVETKTPFELVYVGKKADEAVKNAFKKINPLGAVPALELENGKILTQNIAILEYVADQHPETELLAKAGSFERAETMLWLSLIASDLHKSFLPLFSLTKISNNEEAQTDIKKWAASNIDKYLTIIDQQLQNHKYISGEKFTIADCYLYTVYQWMGMMHLPTEKYAAINRYNAMLDERPSIKLVHVKEEEVS